jgi:hypothetical protein
VTAVVPPTKIAAIRPPSEPRLKARCHCRECQYISSGAPNMFMLMASPSRAAISPIGAEPRVYLLCMRVSIDPAHLPNLRDARYLCCDQREFGGTAMSPGLQRSRWCCGRAKETLTVSILLVAVDSGRGAPEPRRSTASSASVFLRNIKHAPSSSSLGFRDWHVKICAVRRSCDESLAAIVCKAANKTCQAR